MSSVLDRSALEQSPLADLHLLANELGVDGFRRLRKADLIDAILARQAGERPRRRRRGRRRRRAPTTPRTRRRREPRAEDAAASRRAARASRPRADDGRARRDDAARRPSAATAAAATATRRGRDRSAATTPAEDKRRRGRRRAARPTAPASSACRRREPTDDDVYVSAAQVKRCELVSGDRVAGPVRPPRRSERFPSLVRVDTINGRPADEVAEGTRFEDLPVAFPAERLELGSEDPTVKAIEWLTPFGKGSRVVDRRPGARRQERGAAPHRRRARPSEGGVELSVVLAGVRPGGGRRVAERPGRARRAVTFAASADAQAQAVEQAVEQGRRVAARGGDAVVLIDTLEYVCRRPPRAARWPRRATSPTAAR